MTPTTAWVLAAACPSKNNGHRCSFLPQDQDALRHTNIQLSNRPNTSSLTSLSPASRGNTPPPKTPPPHSHYHHPLPARQRPQNSYTHIHIRPISVTTTNYSHSLPKHKTPITRQFLARRSDSATLGVYAAYVGAAERVDAERGLEEEGGGCEGGGREVQGLGAACKVSVRGGGGGEKEGEEEHGGWLWDVRMIEIEVC